MATKRIVLALIAALGFGTQAAAASPCDASVHAELTHVERKELVTTHTYSVEVTTLEPCATVRFTLYSTERISKTKVKVVKTSGEVRVRGGTVSQILNHDMPNERQLVKWDVKLAECARCAS